MRHNNSNYKQQKKQNNNNDDGLHGNHKNSRSKPDTVQNNASPFNALMQTNLNSFTRSPKLDEKPMSKIKRESLKADFANSDLNAYSPTLKSPKTLADDKVFNRLYNGDAKNSNVKKELEKIKLENGNDNDKLMDGEETVQNNNKKRASSANSSPYKEKKRKTAFDDVALDQQLLPPTNHDRIDSNILPPPQQKPLITKVYYSYFERTSEDRDEIREIK